jgi:integrase
VGRRSPGDGSVYQRKDGYWVAQYGGKYRYSKDKGAAKKKLLKLMTAAEEVQPETITVETHLNRWIEYTKPNLKPRTIKRYKEAIDVHLKPAFGKQKLHKLDALDIQDFYSRKLEEGLSPSTIGLIHSVLSSALKRAVRWKLIKHNVCKDVDTPRIQREEVRPFTTEQVRALLSAASEDRLEALWILALSTGMRSAELLGVKRQQMDFERGTLAVNRTFYNGVEGTPKSKNGRRTLKLPYKALAALREHIEQGQYEDNDLLFLSNTGKPIWSYSFVMHYWKPLTERACVP